METCKTTIDFIRHGEPVGGSRYRGCGIDDPLSEKGWAQMRATTDNLTGWHHIISSPMLRCRAFADWLGEQRDVPVTVIENLREVGFGAWEGMSRTELIAQRAAEYHAFHANPVTNRPSGAESLADFSQRISGVFDHLADAYPGQHVLVVAHAGVIRAALGHVIQAPPIHWYRTAVSNASLTRFMFEAGNAQLILHNWRPTIAGDALL